MTTTRNDRARTDHAQGDRPRSGRAAPLSGDDRRAMIIEAAIPLLVAHGREVTTRQIADAAGIAEGTVFRAFGDKDSVIEAAVQKFLDPAQVYAAIRGIDPDAPLETKVADILTHLRARMTGIFGIMHSLGMVGRPPIAADHGDFTALITEVLGPDLGRLNVEPAVVARFLRLLAFASSVGPFNDGQEISPEAAATLITHGIAGRPAERS